MAVRLANAGAAPYDDELFEIYWLGKCWTLMYWDPEIESPASIAVIGGGPVGIEAALYGRFLGYNVDLFDAKRPAWQAVRWNEREIEQTVERLTTPLGLAALNAQEDRYSPPNLDSYWAGKDFAEKYLLPIAKSDLLIDGIHINSSVVEVARSFHRFHEIDDLQERANDDFRLTINSRDRGTYISRAEIVLDCRSLYEEWEGCGAGGSNPIGYDENRDKLQRWLPGDPRFQNRMLAGKKVAVFGDDHLAALFVVESMDKLPGDARPKELTWLVPSSHAGKVEMRSHNEALFDKARTVATQVLTVIGIERVACNASETLATSSQLPSMESSEYESMQWRLTAVGDDESSYELDADVFACFTRKLPTKTLMPTGYSYLQSDHIAQFAEYSNFKVFEPFKDWAGWSAATGEPNYYRMGSTVEEFKKHGLLRSFAKIRDVYALLGGRIDLNLYRTSTLGE